MDLTILPQPNFASCGPTCLQSIYNYYGDDVGLDQVVREVQYLEAGGTLAVFLACHALRRGYQTTIYTYNLQVFDPTWFFYQNPGFLKKRLEKQASARTEDKICLASRAYMEYIDLGGEIRFEDLSRDLIRRHLKVKIPILTGLSSTYLYRSMREWGPNCDDDDLRGEPQGHFVVLCGYNGETKQVRVADPLLPNDYAGNEQYYEVFIDRLICATMLGIVTFDANLLIIQPAQQIKR